MVLILGIETSCDETAAAVVEDGQKIHSNVIASQIELHAQYGGVFPEIAARAHIESISLIVNQALNEAGLALRDIDVIAVTQGPGLAGALLVGVNFAKGLALATGKPLLGIHHLEGHIHSLWLVEPERPILFPALNLIVSGGHTELILMNGHGDYRYLGGTIDDAAGEAFDKVGRLLGLPFPGGPSIQKAATGGNAKAYDFPRALQDTTYDFSFSGLKTAVMRAVRPPQQHKKRLAGEESLKSGEIRSDVSLADVAASFQAAVVDVLVEKTLRAARDYQPAEILLSGGVSANQLLRQKIGENTDVPVRFPPFILCTDNAAMIAAAAFFRYTAGQRSDLSLDVYPNWDLMTLIS